MGTSGELENETRAPEAGETCGHVVGGEGPGKATFCAKPAVQVFRSRLRAGHGETIVGPWATRCAEHAVASSALLPSPSGGYPTAVNLWPTPPNCGKCGGAISPTGFHMCSACSICEKAPCVCKPLELKAQTVDLGAAQRARAPGLVSICECCGGAHTHLPSHTVPFFCAGCSACGCDKVRESCQAATMGTCSTCNAVGPIRVTGQCWECLRKAILAAGGTVKTIPVQGRKFFEDAIGELRAEADRRVLEGAQATGELDGLGQPKLPSMEKGPRSIHYFTNCPCGKDHTRCACRCGCFASFEREDWKNFYGVSGLCNACGLAAVEGRATHGPRPEKTSLGKEKGPPSSRGRPVSLIHDELALSADDHEKAKAILDNTAKHLVMTPVACLDAIEPRCRRHGRADAHGCDSWPVQGTLTALAALEPAGRVPLEEQSSYVDKGPELKDVALRSIYALHAPYCRDQECLICGVLACPLAEPMHYHHDGCPAEPPTEDGNRQKHDPGCDLLDVDPAIGRPTKPCNCMGKMQKEPCGTCDGAGCPVCRPTPEPACLDCGKTPCGCKGEKPAKVEIRESFESEKYTVIFYSDGRLEALRHGEPWRTFAGDKLVLAMLQEVARLRDGGSP
jgi:hypothetical protein